MKLAVVIFRYFPHGGLQKDFLSIAKEAIARGNSVTAFVAEQEGDLPFPVCRLEVNGRSNHSRMKDFEAKVHTALREEYPDMDKVVMFNRISGGDFYFAADNCLQTEWRKHHSSLILKLLPRYRTFLQLEKSVLDPVSSRTKILTIVPRQIKDYKAVYQTPDERLFLLPPGIDPGCRRPENIREIRQKICREFSIPEQNRILIQIAAQFRIKGVDRTLRALATLPEQYKKGCTLLIVGGDTGALCPGLVKSLRLQDQVIFTGARSDIPDLLAASDLMVHPARNESAGSVITEALAIGIPVIASDACGFAPFAGEVDPQLVTPEPFCQQTLNDTLLYALEHLAELQKTAVASAPSRDFYRRASAALDLIETC